MTQGALPHIDWITTDLRSALTRRREADRLWAAAIDAARQEGWSWHRIARVLEASEETIRRQHGQMAGPGRRAQPATEALRRRQGGRGTSQGGRPLSNG